MNDASSSNQVYVCYTSDDIDTLAAVWCIGRKYKSIIHIHDAEDIIDTPQHALIIVLGGDATSDTTSDTTGGGISTDTIARLTEHNRVILLDRASSGMNQQTSLVSTVTPSYSIALWKMLFKHTTVPKFISLITAWVIASTHSYVGRFSDPFIVGLSNSARDDDEVFDRLFSQFPTHAPKISSIGSMYIKIADDIVSQLSTKAQRVLFMGKRTLMIESTTMRPELSIFLANERDIDLSIVWWYNLAKDVFTLWIRTNNDSRIDLMRLLSGFKPSNNCVVGGGGGGGGIGGINTTTSNINDTRSTDNMYVFVDANEMSLGDFIKYHATPTRPIGIKYTTVSASSTPSTPASSTSILTNPPIKIRDQIGAVL
jgi:hypothetical protein